MAGTSTVGRRAAQVSFAMAGIVPVVAGSCGVLQPLLAPVGAAVNHGRYLSGLLLGIGLLFWAAIPRLERETTRIRVLTTVVVVGGLCRLMGVVLGDPLSPSVAGALAMELVVTPLLCLWQSRLRPDD